MSEYKKKYGVSIPDFAVSQIIPIHHANSETKSSVKEGTFKKKSEPNLF